MPQEVVSNENLVKTIDEDDDAGPPRPSTACGRSICCDPYGIVHRFIVFIFMCFLNFGELKYSKIVAIQPDASLLTR